jgi:hypothetical protein
LKLKLSISYSQSFFIETLKSQNSLDSHIFNFEISLSNKLDTFFDKSLLNKLSKKLKTFFDNFSFEVFKFILISSFIVSSFQSSFLFLLFSSSFFHLDSLITFSFASNIFL